MKNNQTQTNQELTGIIVPPGCDHPMLHQCGEPVSTYTPASYCPFSASKLPTTPHAMHGKSGGLSVPKNVTELSQKSMTEYLNHFCGAYLCLDFWMDSRMRFKRCGILTEVGTDFLALQESNGSKLSIIDLKPVRYINIYCK